ncbi:MAG: hypothetical protein JO005_11060, partial [Gammaproteobacteria bacterium]|nr:hypothetical protein [Gammaproteobacteria bacterium]
MDTEVMLVWFREGHPSAPTNLVPAAHSLGELKGGNAALQPQAAPPRAPAPAATPGPAAGAAVPQPAVAQEGR